MLTAAPGLGANLYSTFLNLASNNVGTVYRNASTTPFSYAVSGRMKITTADGVPTTGTWVAGDLCYNAVPAVGSPIGWMCRTGGTPGTWTALANL
jgi:hypothetical protein